MIKAFSIFMQFSDHHNKFRLKVNKEVFKVERCCLKTRCVGESVSHCFLLSFCLSVFLSVFLFVFLRVFLCEFLLFLIFWLSVFLSVLLCVLNLSNFLSAFCCNFVFLSVSMSAFLCFSLCIFCLHCPYFYHLFWGRFLEFCAQLVHLAPNF